MAEAVDRAWRTLATAVAFAVFGLGGLIARVLVFPLLHAVLRGERRRTLVSRHLIQIAFRWFIAMMRALGVISLEVRGAERLRRHGLLILANHPSLIDVVILMALVDGAGCVVKSALASNPFTRGPVRAAGFIFNDSGAGLIADCIQALREGDNLIVFPEGTRTPRDAPMRLRRGAAHVAVRGAVDVTPVRIRVTPPTLSKGDRWHDVPPRRAHFIVQVDDDIPIAGFTATADNEASQVRRLTRHLTQHFSREIALADA